MASSDGKASEEGSAAAAPPRAARRRRRGRVSLWLLLSLVLIAGAVGLAGLVLTGRALPLPVWAVAEIEERMNRALAPAQGAAQLSVSLTGIDLTIGRDWAPQLRLEDVRLRQSGGRPLLTLPEARIGFDASSLAGFRLHPRSVDLVGARFALRRLEDGRFDLGFGGGGGRIGSYADVMRAVDRVFALPLLADLRRVEAEGMSLTLEDRRARRTWQVGDGRLVLDTGPERRELEVGLTLLGRADQAPAQAVLTFVTTPGSPEARISATVDRVAAADIAAQALPITWLGVLDAQLSGRVSAALDAEGRLTGLEAELNSGAGALRPRPDIKPIPFEKAGLAFSYDPAAEKISLTDLKVESRSLNFTATGHSYLPGVQQGMPEAFLAQIRFGEVNADPAGLFEQPVTFSEGALDLRMRLDPFSIDIGQISLAEGTRRLTGKGRVAAEPEGWRVGFDMTLNEISHQGLLALWPLSLVPRTRDWVVNNVQEGSLFDVKAGVRLVPGREPRLALGYEFRDADVRFLKTLPPIEAGSGYATIEGKRYTMVLDRGRVTAPEGGSVAVAQSLFLVPDVTRKPVHAELRLNTKSSVTAALSLLDQPPFRFLSKAGRPVDLGTGRAEVQTVIRLPLKPRLTPDEVEFSVAGRIFDFRSDVLVPGRVLTAPDLTLSADPAGFSVSGAGKLGAAPFDATFTQGLTPEERGRSRIEGTATLSQVPLDEFGIGLPRGLVSGSGPGRIVVELEKNQPPKLTLTSALTGIGLSLPELGFRKAASASGRLEVQATLGKPASVQRLVVEGGGLQAEGSVALRADGQLDQARLDRVRLNGWLDAPVTLVGQGKGMPPEVSVTGGSVDLRRLSLGSGGGGGGGAPVTVRVQLDRLLVTEKIALTGLGGVFDTKGGFRGDFAARVNGGAVVRGALAPVAQGTAVRILSEDAGGVMASTGIFPDARGGSLDLNLLPTGPKGHYNGHASASDVRVQNAPVLAALLSAISVVGILEQLNGDGLVFNQAEADFRLTPAAIEITRGSAVGASLGVSVAGIYDVVGKRLDMQGVISPIYLLNGIGAVLTRRGEGLFGFNYKLGGSSDRPSVTVNPLSILTPGMFREIFRAPAPVLEGP